ncbi:MAG TPA: LemA family protein [Mucilaginibacter sp.]
MKKLLSILLIACAAMGLSSCSYNSMVKLDENVKAKWGAVQSDYQRRSDLIPNLVNTVKGAANFEKGTLTAVVEARAKATSVQVDPAKLTPESIKAFQASQGELTQALGKLISITENYPDLKSNQNFRDLQVQLEGTENRINVSRKDFNDAVQEYNGKIRSFPANITAKMFGFSEKGYFTAEPGSEKAPKVQL